MKILQKLLLLPVDGATAHDPDMLQNRLMFLVFMFHASFSDHVPTVYQIKNINQKLICNIATHCTFVCTTIKGQLISKANSKLFI